MHHQKLKERLDESLGVRDGAERSKEQSMASRRHESEGMTKHYTPILDEERMRHEHATRHHMDHLERHCGQ